MKRACVLVLVLAVHTARSIVRSGMKITLLYNKCRVYKYVLRNGIADLDCPFHYQAK